MSSHHLIVDRWDIHHSVWSGWFRLDMEQMSIVSDLGSRDVLVESSRQIVVGDEMRPLASLRLSKEKEKG